MGVATTDTIWSVVVITLPTAPQSPEAHSSEGTKQERILGVMHPANACAPITCWMVLRLQHSASTY